MQMLTQTSEISINSNVENECHSLAPMNSTHYVCIDYLLFIALSSQSKALSPISLSLSLSLSIPVFNGIFATTWNYWKLTHAFVWEFQN